MLIRAIALLCENRIDYGLGVMLLMDCWLRNVRVHNISLYSSTNGMRFCWGVNTFVCHYPDFIPIKTYQIR